MTATVLSGDVASQSMGSGGTSPVVARGHLVLDSLEQVFPARDGKPPFHALGPLSLELAQGEFFSIVGPSGCGKSTLLDIAAGLAQPERGSVFFEGQPVKNQVPDGISVVFQEDACFPWLNVFDNAAFGARRAGLPEEEVASRVDYALSFMGLTSFTTSFPSRLSGGMRQRVCIARALVMRPRMLLLDEPFGALDQQTRLLMGEETLKLWRETGVTIMLITHSIDEAVLLSDRIGIMSSRPGRFIDIIETGWDRERDRNSASVSARFGELSSEVWRQLRDESLKALRSDL